MKQKRNSHIRKSNYHPPKIQTVKPVLLFLILCLAGGSGIYIVHRLSSRFAGGGDKTIHVFSKKT